MREKWKEKKSAALAFFNWKLITFTMHGTLVLHNTTSFAFFLRIIFGYWPLASNMNGKKIPFHSMLMEQDFLTLLFSHLYHSITFSFELWTGFMWNLLFYVPMQQWRIEKKSSNWKAGMILNAWLTLDYIGLRYHRSTDAEPLHSLHVNEI